MTPPPPELAARARRGLARLPSLRMARLPDAPAPPVRDPWPGEPDAVRVC